MEPHAKREEYGCLVRAEKPDLRRPVRAKGLVSGRRRNARLAIADSERPIYYGIRRVAGQRQAGKPDLRRCGLLLPELFGFGMGHLTAEHIAQRAFDLGLLDERQLQEVWATLGSRNVASNEFLQVLVRREYLTNYQVERLVKGDRSGFFYGPYKVLYLVGSGSFARVFRAVHRETRAVVAIKVLRNRYSENPAQFEQFVREGRVGCTLRHPNIVPIYEVFSQGKTHFLVMEFVEGWNLREVVKIRKKIDSLQALKLVVDMAEGLRYAFEHGLTHRDLKMNNVLVSTAGQAKLVDFGLAGVDDAVADDLNADAPNARSIDYAALERATGVRKDDTRSDIYFLGCIFYNMLTGVAPLSETRDRLQRLSKSRFLEVVPIQKAAPQLPHWITMVVNKAMTLDPVRRYQSPAAMLTDLHLAIKQLTEGGPDAAPPPEAAEQEPAAAVPPPQPGLTVMVVESNADWQDIFRKGFKRAGYRMLLTEDPARALSRFRQDGTVADCVIFSAQQLGRQAVDMFNHFADDPKTNFVRAVLLLDEKQHDWQNEAIGADHRRVVCLPITMKQLCSELVSLVGVKRKA
jgi:eukaryotic-like serine/threonine-protein kinase